MTMVIRLTAWVLGWQAGLDDDLARCLTPRRRDERGLSQSTETALLVAGAVLVASIIFVAVKALVQAKMNQATGAAEGVG